MDAIPEISVIIPVYNVEKYLHSCVDSVLKQTFQNFEIIMVDDGSPDSCPEMCDRYAASDSRIRVIHKRNAGLGYARNSGLDVARGEYVCFLDSDDYIETNTLEYCLSVARKEDADQVRFLYGRFKADVIPTPKKLKVASSYIVDDSEHRLEPMMAIISPLLSEQTLFAPTNASSCTAIYRREVIEKNKIRFYSEREVKSEDYIFGVDFGMACRRIVYTENKFYKYRYNPRSLTQISRFDRVERAVVFSELLAEKLKGYGFPDSDIYAMGYTIGTMREQNRNIFLAHLPWRERKAAFLKVLDCAYVKKIQRDYPVEKLPKIQRIAFNLHVNRYFVLSWLITRVRELWKE